MPTAVMRDRLGSKKTDRAKERNGVWNDLGLFFSLKVQNTLLHKSRNEDGRVSEDCGMVLCSGNLLDSFCCTAYFCPISFIMHYSTELLNSGWLGVVD